ncbi:unnamed protein product [Nippostrongylus brasiliensis]|uniref:Uncharacterized protein n=1 Tax=Nippostrongylus brasiliensis TaxID=27835 RepID=A0A0N4Y945_NIPBR|nr:unnamed protein product [Nippostrongylus brasiliensis]
MIYACCGVKIRIKNNRFQLGDDPSECRLIDTRGRRRPLLFVASSAPRLLRLATNLSEITILMKEVDAFRNPYSTTSVGDCSPFTPGGYLGRLFGPCPPPLPNLKQLSLHVDVMVESISVSPLPCPSEDLQYALNALSSAPFRTFVQISFCCAQFRESDVAARSYLIAGMEQTLKAAAEAGADTEFEVEPEEGYVDMTIEKGRVEYTFAFFYYNPSICEPAPTEDAVDRRKTTFI